MDVDFSSYTSLSITREDGVLTVTFDRPDVLNAVNQQVHEELETLFTDIERDDATQIVVITGSGRAFSAGGDLDWLLVLNASPVASARAIKGDRLIQHGMLSMEKPVIAKVNGPAVGLGCSIALFCDVVVASTNAYFADPHVSVGLVAGDGGSLLWPQLIGYARARRYLLTGDPIPATEAAEIGLITEVVEPAELDETVQNWVERLRRQPVHALRWTKTSINAGLRDVALSVLDSSAGFENVTQLMDDHREAVLALQKKTTERAAAREQT